jgi:hypothetical protein
VGTNSHWLESRKSLMERRRKALEEAGLMSTGTDACECEKYLDKRNY